MTGAAFRPFEVVFVDLQFAAGGLQFYDAPVAQPDISKADIMIRGQDILYFVSFGYNGIIEHALLRCRDNSGVKAV